MENQKPSTGRIVHYRDYHDNTCPAMITKVHNDSCVDLVVFDASGAHGGAAVPYTSVIQGASPVDPGGWTWPPFVKPAEVKLTQVGDARFERPAVERMLENARSVFGSPLGAVVSPVSAPPIGGLVQTTTAGTAAEPEKMEPSDGLPSAGDK